MRLRYRIKPSPRQRWKKTGKAGVDYPYFFLNWGSPAGTFGFSDRLPFMGTGWWIIALFIFLILIGLLYLAIIGRIRRVRAGRASFPKA